LPENQDSAYWQCNRGRSSGSVRAWLDVSELVPPEKYSELRDRNVADFDAAVEAFISGDWDEARELLGRMPAKDRAKDFLLRQVACHNYEPPDYEPPADRDGVITLCSQ